MTHPEIVDRYRDRRLRCPTPGCEELLGRTASAWIGDSSGAITFIWKCPRCDKYTELIVDVSEGCWVSGGNPIVHLLER